MRKYELIQREEGRHPVTFMCRLLNVHRTGFYAWKQQQGDDPSARELRRRELADLIGQLWIDSRKILGVRRIHAELIAQGFGSLPFLSVRPVPDPPFS